MNDDVRLAFDLALDPPSRLVGDADPLHLVARVRAHGKPVDGGRPRLAVVFVLDASSSMNGEPMEQVLDSVARLVDLLHPTDRTGVVAFADEASAVHELRALDGATKAAIKRRVAGIRAYGNTNIEAGLRAAGALFQEDQEDQEGERRVIVLLSDGAPNRQAATIDALAEVVAPLRARASVVTLGYGPSHNADVLASIAKAGGGTYWFVPDPKEANVEFARALGAQGDVVVDGVELVLSPEDGVEIAEVLGAAGKTRFTAKGLVVPLPDLMDGGEHTIVARVLVPAADEPGRARPVAAIARWRRAGRKDVHEVPREVALDHVKDQDRTVPRVPWAAQALVLARAERARLDARGRADHGNYDAAAAILRATMAELAAAPGYEAGSDGPLSEAYEQLFDEVVAYETRPSAEDYQQFRSAQLGVDLQQGGRHVATTAGTSASAQAMIGAVTGAVLPGFLVVRERDGDEVRVPLRSEMTIGRVPGNDVVLPKGNISKRHTRIVCRDGKLIVVDLKTTNGTYVNGKRVGTPTVLGDDDRVFIGDFTLTVDRGE